MRIGILTFHRAINYGAVLQAFALQQTLRSLGHDVWIIDYKQARVERTDRHPFLDGDKMRLLKGLHVRSWWRYDQEKKRVLARRKRFDDFLNKYLLLTESCGRDNIPNFDLYVVGSDQVWNSAICDGLDPVFWGDFKHLPNSNIISYAASTSVKDLKKQDRNVIQSYLNNFEYVSVREQASCDYLNQMFTLGHPAQTVLDPTLLAKREIWDSFDDDKYKGQEYVLYFGARSCRNYPTVLHDKATALARQCGCDVKHIDFNADSPVDFVNKIRYAKAVVTSSFHGTAFSLIFNRPLYAVMYGDEQDARYVNVLKSIGAEEMLVELHQGINVKEYDYLAVEVSLENLRSNSINYMKII